MIAFATSAAVTKALLVVSGTVTLPNVVLPAVESIVKDVVLGVIVNFLSLAVTVNRFVLSLSTVKRWSCKRTSPVPVLPLNAKFTDFNCATFTASVSFVPAATPVI